MVSEREQSSQYNLEHTFQKIEESQRKLFANIDRLAEIRERSCIEQLCELSSRVESLWKKTEALRAEIEELREEIVPCKQAECLEP